MAKKIVCRFCNGEFDEMLPKCPYCDSTNYKGAEAEYLEKLDDVREDMEDLEEVPEEETKKEFCKQGRFLVKIFLILGIIILAVAGILIWDSHQYDRDEKADYLWKQENIPYLDELYAQEQYEEAVAFYLQASGEDKPVWSWEHSDFVSIYMEVMTLQELLGREAVGEVLDQYDYVSLLDAEWIILSIDVRDLDEQEKAILAHYEEMAGRDFEERWDMSQEEYDAFYSQITENYGWVEYSDVKAYVKKWYEGK